VLVWCGVMAIGRGLAGLDGVWADGLGCYGRSIFHMSIRQAFMVAIRWEMKGKKVNGGWFLEPRCRLRYWITEQLLYNISYIPPKRLGPIARIPLNRLRCYSS
jgi:hypothetical protein